MLVLERRYYLNQNELFFCFLNKDAILSVLTAKDMVRHLLVVVIFVPSCKIPVEVELYMRKLWGYITIINILQLLPCGLQTRCRAVCV